MSQSVAIKILKFVVCPNRSFACQLPEERKVDLLKNLAECSPYTTPQDSRQIFPSVVQLLKVCILYTAS